MLVFIRKKLILYFVIVSIIFGCSVHAATPSFKEDLDDFDELQYLDQGVILAEQIKPAVIFWQNEDLAQTLIVTNTLTDDLEQFTIRLGQHLSLLITSFAFITPQSEYIHIAQFGSAQARAPPFFS